jgi:hypothetical protein
MLCRQVVFDTLGKSMLRFGYTKIKIFGIYLELKYPFYHILQGGKNSFVFLSN